MNAELAGDLVLGALTGLGLGALHMLWLWRAAARLGARAGAWALLGGALLRLAAVMAGFALLMRLAQQPAAALAAALAGFAVVRALALRRARRGS